MITNLSADDKQFDFIKNKKILCWKIKHRGFFFTDMVKLWIIQILRRMGL